MSKPTPGTARRHPWETPLALAFVLKSWQQVTQIGPREWSYPAPRADYRLSVSGHEPACRVGGCSCKAGVAGRPCYHSSGLALRLLEDDWASEGLSYDLAALVAEHGEERAAEIVLPQVLRHLPRYGHTTPTTNERTKVA